MKRTDCKAFRSDAEIIELYFARNERAIAETNATVHCAEEVAAASE